MPTSYSLLLGVLLAIWLPTTWHAPAAWIVGAGAAFSLCMARWQLPVFLALGFFLASQAAGKVLGGQVACDDRVLAIGRIVSVPERTPGGWQFDAMLHFPRSLRPDVRARVSSAGSFPRPKPGESWQLALQLRGSASRQKGVAQRRALLRDHVSIEARTLRSPLNRRLAAPARSLMAMREQVANRIELRVADPSAAALLSALAVGVTGSVSRQQWRVFNATGITHLVAISGMHVTFLAMICMAIARRLWALVPPLAIHVRREIFAGAVGVLLATAYALLSGFSVPAQRTLVMLLAFLFAREAARSCGALWSVGVALFVVLVYDPLAVLGAGFWLSFLAVASIIQLAGARLGSGNPLRSAASVQVIVSVALMPATLLLFGTFSTSGLLVNAFAIPVFTFLLVPPVLLATVGYLIPADSTQWIADRLVDLSAWVASIGYPLLVQAAEHEGSLLRAFPVASWYLVSVPAAFMVILPLRPMLRTAGAALLLFVLMMRAPGPHPGELWIDVLDAGAATSVIVSTANRRLVFGAGEAFGSRGRRFEERVAGPLLERGDGDTSALIVGRLNADTLRAIVVADALLRVPMVVRNAGGAGPPEIAPCTSRTWNWDGILFELSPGSTGTSCALIMHVGSRRVVLSQDEVDADAADWMLLPRNLRVQQASQIQRALRAGGTAVASTDQREWQANRWSELRHEMEAKGIFILSTAAQGALHFEFSPGARVRMHNSRALSPGIWMRVPRDHSCAVGL